ncbi:respiratory nitrate reductase subunit gamma [Mailhella sp.]|uniref:respiratory nitrate reductase subunit gamma n=1 Tax=Mailhella sp. TaxID=1981029 RepID=UPI004062F480
MSIVFFMLAYAAVLVFAGVAALRIFGYLKKPQHLRWELYPVAHESPERAGYGGSYLEDVDWWKRDYHRSFLGALKGFLVEALLLRATWEHNRPLWVRTYPFHVGLYLLIGGMGLTLLSAFGMLAGAERFVAVCTFLTALCDVLGFGGVLFGAVGLIQRRLSDKGLRKYSTPEYFFNLALFGVYALLGLVLCLTYSAWDFALMGNAFFYGMLTFTAVDLLAPLYMLYLLLGFFLFFWVPYSFLGHLFMKYFTWHDIRWGDEPSSHDPGIQRRVASNLDLPVSWRAPHIRGDGVKTWAEVATSDPEKQD